MTHHADDCGVSCGLTECDCGADKAASVELDRDTLEHVLELLENPTWTLGRIGLIAKLRGILKTIS